MRHPDIGTWGYGPVWFAKYAVLFVLPLLFLLVVFHAHDGWYLGLSIYWAVSISFLAWRRVSESIGWGWRILLAIVMVSSWTYSTMFVLSVPGDMQICYDRIYPNHPRGPSINLGPDPNCRGTRLQEVRTD